MKEDLFRFVGRFLVVEKRKDEPEKAEPGKDEPEKAEPEKDEPEKAEPERDNLFSTWILECPETFFYL